MASKFIVEVGENCVACGACEDVCSKGVIKVKNSIKSGVDIDSCIGCGLCANICPAGIIERVERGKMVKKKHWYNICGFTQSYI